MAVVGMRLGKCLPELLMTGVDNQMAVTIL
jgi:hypothetical protein